jgi:adenosylhomocysteinase
MNADVKDLKLADSGRRLIEWADRQMPVLRRIRERFATEKPLDGLRIAAGLHITSETAVLMRTLKAGGAELALCGSNPLSTRDEICASLVVHEGVAVHARYQEDLETYYAHVKAVLALEPHILMDDGADLIARQPNGMIIGALEETTTGVIRVRAMERQGLLRFPVIAVNDSPTRPNTEEYVLATGERHGDVVRKPGARHGVAGQASRKTAAHRLHSSTGNR